MTRAQSSHLAGTWYAAGTERLRMQVDELLATAAVALQGAMPCAGIVVPHAGYAYSGRAAAAAYALLRGGDYRRAVILAPSHYAAFRGVALPDVEAFETPLGVTPVDRSALALLRAAPLFRCDPEPYQREHAFEIQLPLLQRVLPHIAVVPALLGGFGAADYVPVAATLAQLADASTLFVVSSDLVHYGSRFDYLPFPPAGVQAVRSGVRALDMGAIERVCAGDAAGFLDYIASTGATICGRVPIATFLVLHAGRTPGTLLAYETSLDITGDYEHSVSYASIAFPRTA